jgi:hypothetical protein
MGKASLRKRRPTPPPVRPEAATVASRLEDLLTTIEARYPEPWWFFDDSRLLAGKDLPRWPEWC